MYKWEGGPVFFGKELAVVDPEPFSGCKGRICHDDQVHCFQEVFLGIQYRSSGTDHLPGLAGTMMDVADIAATTSSIMF